VAAFAQSVDQEDRAPSEGGLAPTAAASNGAPRAAGTLLFGPIDVQNTITSPPAPGALWNRLLGTARAWGYIWVSGGAGTGGVFEIHQYDLTGAYIQSFTKDMSQATASVWGMRDMAIDEANFKM
jgi:hypothetical protein